MAAVCDVEQMFHSFHVSPEHRILRFLWFEENNPSKPIAKFQMTVHLFGNGPSRAVATYGLRKTVKHGEEADVKEFVERNSCVDDGRFRRLLKFRALRNAGYWLIGSHGAIAKLISSCIFCKKLLGLLLEQKMADLPHTERRLGLPLPASVSTCLEHG